MECDGLGQAKQVQRGIQGSGGVVSPEQGGEMWNRGQNCGERINSVKQGNRYSRVTGS